MLLYTVGSSKKPRITRIFMAFHLRAESTQHPPKVGPQSIKRPFRYDLDRMYHRCSSSMRKHLDKMQNEMRRRRAAQKQNPLKPRHAILLEAQKAYPPVQSSPGPAGQGHEAPW